MSTAQMILPLMDQNLANMNANKDNWSQRFDEYEIKLEHEKEKLKKLSFY